MGNWLTNIFGGGGNSTPAQSNPQYPAPTSAPYDPSINYSGPYSSNAYNAASMIKNGGAGAPYSKPIIDAGNAILGAQKNTQAPPDPNGTSSATKLPDRSADISTQNAALGQVDPMQNGGIDSINKALGGLNTSYDAQAATNRANHESQSGINTNNLLRNEQTAYTNAAQGRRGLLSTLSSIGALSGTGIQLANNAVQQGANADLSNAGDTFQSNKQGLDQNLANFTTADKARRDENQNQANEAIQATKNQALVNRQKIYGALADDYAQQGDKVNQAKYTQMVNDLFPQITGTSMPNTNLSAGVAAYTPTTLSNYIGGGTNSAQVVNSPGSATQLPGLMTGGLDRRRAA